MRLGDLDALKATINNVVDEEIRFEQGWAMGLKYSIKLIDSAPTVVPEDFMNPYEEGYERARKDFERPHGKWIIQPHSMIMRCSLCGHEENAKDVGTINPDKHFCYFCGAGMQKGDK